MFWHPFFQQCNVILVWYGGSLTWKYEGKGSRKGGLKQGVASRQLIHCMMILWKAKIRTAAFLLKAKHAKLCFISAPCFRRENL